MFKIRALPVAISVMSILIMLPALAQADAAKGKHFFKKQCAVCHSVKPGVNKMGPSLAGVVGRPAGSTDFKRYKGLKQADWVWHRAELANFLADPETFLGKPTTMYANIDEPDDCADVIDYLETLE